MSERVRTVCGAKNRQGNPCQLSPVPGRARCRLHGGKTPARATHKGNRKHGLYAAHLTAAEAEHWDDIPLGDVDAEIRMVRVWLGRCMALDGEIGKDPNSASNLAGFQLSEIRRYTDENGSRTDETSKRPDVSARIDRLLGRLGQLEKVRAELLAAAQAAGEGAGDKAQDLVDTLKSMKRVEFEQPAGTDDAADDE